MASGPDAAHRASDAAANTSDASLGEAGAERDNAESADAAIASRDCSPGTYTGTFSGAIYAGLVPVLGLTGLINAELVQDSGDELLRVRDARVVGSDVRGNTVSFTFSGRINCIGYTLEEGLLNDGLLHLAAANTDIAFRGSATGSYIPDPAAVFGSWEAYADATVLLSGGGEFSMLRAQ